MKKILVLVVGLLSVITLSACDEAIDTVLDDSNALSSEEGIATLSYLSTGFLDFSTADPVVSNIVFLAEEETTVIEEELDEVNVYIDRLKGFIDNGVETFGSVTEAVSDNELFDYKITFTVNEESYVIYYNIDQETLEVSGIIVLGDIEYEFEVVDHINNYEMHQEKHEEKEENKGNDTQNKNGTSTESSKDQDDAEEPEETTTDSEVTNTETEEKMTLIARNGDDIIKIIYKTETEEDESTTKFYMEQTLNGVTKEIELKISVEENEYKVDVVDGENEFTFKRDVEEDGVVYKLMYKVDGVEGTVKIIETTDELGENIYEYQIKEAGKNKNVTKGKPESKGFDTHEEEETEEETGNIDEV